MGQRLDNSHASQKPSTKCGFFMPTPFRTSDENIYNYLYSYTEVFLEVICYLKFNFDIFYYISLINITYMSRNNIKRKTLNSNIKNEYFCIIFNLFLDNR